MIIIRQRVESKECPGSWQQLRILLHRFWISLGSLTGVQFVRRTLINRMIVSLIDDREHDHSWLRYEIVNTGCLKKVASRILRAMVHSPLKAKYTSLEMTLLQNVFFWSFLTRTSRIKRSQVMFLARFDPTQPNSGANDYVSNFFWDTRFIMI